jgi:hypothetical protein
MECGVRSDDHYRVGQMPQPRAQSAAIAVTAVAAVVVLAGCGHSAASAVTTLTSARNATVVSASGRAAPGLPGMRLHRGDAVRTGVDGSAILSTSGRTAYLGADGDYTVTNGAQGVLQRGAFVVDARHGPQLRLHVGSLSLRTNRSAVRVERTFAIRIGALAGGAFDVTSTAAVLTVPALHQVVVAGRALPAETTPLVLTDDDAERRVIPDLVFDDQQLTNTAAALNLGTEGRTIVAVGQRAGLHMTISTASLRTQPAVAAAEPVSEAALPIAIARAATASARDATAFQAHYRDAAQARKAGGSWGVVAHLNGTDATATAQAIATLLGSAGVGGPTTAPGPGATNTNPLAPRQSGGPSSAPGNNAGGGNGGGSTPTPGPTPSPSPSPSGGALQPVQDLVGAIVGILPTPGPGGGGTASSGVPNKCKLLGLLNC